MFNILKTVRVRIHKCTCAGNVPLISRIGRLRRIKGFFFKRRGLCGNSVSCVCTRVTFSCDMQGPPVAWVYKPNFMTIGKQEMPCLELPSVVMLWSPSTLEVWEYRSAAASCSTQRLGLTGGHCSSRILWKCHPFRVKGSGSWKCAKIPSTIPAFIVPVVVPFSLEIFGSPSLATGQPHLWPASSRKVGLEKLQRSLPQTVLWLCANLGEKEGAQKTSYNLKEELWYV